MKLRRVKTVALKCPINRKNCNTCPYSNGTEGISKPVVYCYYGDED